MSLTGKSKLMNSGEIAGLFGGVAAEKSFL